MKENKRVRQRQHLRWGTYLVLFVIIGTVVKFPLMPINQAEYTDGILQLTQFRDGSGIWPPLYTILCWPLSYIMTPVWSGRTVSTLFSIAGVIPIYLMTRRAFGLQAAVFAALVYTVAPVALRWSPRVMTEATFCFFFWFACERLITAQGARTQQEADRALAWASLLGMLAALTRYQGLMLILPPFAIALVHWRQRGFIPWRGLLSLGLYIAAPVWMIATGTIHGTQFAERAGPAPWTIFLMNAEPFLLYTPYYLTYPVAILAVIGLVKGRARPQYYVLPLTLYVLAVLLVAQSLFSSFQERYLLPGYGLLFVWAGLGMAIANRQMRPNWPRLRPWVPILTVVWSLFISALVLTGSRQVFGDIRDAARFVRELRGQEKAPVYTNEIYREARPGERRIAGDKVAYYLRDEVTFLGPEYYQFDERIPNGSFLVMSSAYGAGQQLERLSFFYEMEHLETFQSVVIPVFADIMSTPGTAQNPLAWHYRYIPQEFETSVWRVTGTRRPAP